MKPNNPQLWALLHQAAARVEHDDFRGYFELKQLLKADDRLQFRKRFTTYYRLNIGGLADEFKERYFELLFACDPVGTTDPHTSLLLDLYKLRRRRGDQSLQASFVTKLVSVHDESQPIFDRHVSHFFGIGVPSVGTTEFRIAGFVENLRRIQSAYEEWAVDTRFDRLLKTLCKKQPRLAQCHPSRVCDFLVWTAGAKVR